MKTEIEKQEAEDQLITEKRQVDYDTREFVVEHIIDKFIEGEYKIPPYQREFVWDKEKQSRFIESVLLDLPIPYLFFADDKDDGKLEIVDGSQRIRTLVAFKNDDLTLKGLEKLYKLNGFKFSDLLESRQRRFLRKTLRSIELTERADFEVKKDIFQRINTDPYDLTDMEIRKGMYQEGEFYNLIVECSQNPLFIELCPISENRQKRGEAQELVLRYFAYSEKLAEFTHRVDVFLDDYIKEKHNGSFNESEMKIQFENMLDFVNTYFPYGFKKAPTHNTTPRVRFETIAVGVTLALKENSNLKVANVEKWLNSEEFKEHTTSDASNNRLKVIGRIEYVKNKLLQNAAN
ncbi:hypothetical protein CGC58_09790 [Capnocytophaga stomatis]|uniref:GmrSD restriction endonucleases N-terminal domain-containing protein n=1 Tax=Capnocytophaga stomatis TaxID=1848904 RepID=A0A250FY12_9FLAO|nr:DUF262 domain-containing protein [Capnocytophaga stomatis]ATA89984.1 hypothetical protein CGC58_09790 [Capnocytophaga stomatis]